MRYLIFGDIHGNLPALEKLFRVEKNNYDLAICHGDVVNYGPWSNECVQFLTGTKNLETLKGNHEGYFLNGEYSGTNTIAQTFFDFCYQNFSEFQAIDLYKPSYSNKDFTVIHTLNGKYFYPDTDLAGLNLDSNYVIGHSHYQFDRGCDKKRLINTGSIGQNRKFINIAEYIILDQQKNTVELKSFKTEIGYLIEKMESLKYPGICLQYYQNKPQAL